jgi:hypothetical protein
LPLVFPKQQENGMALLVEQGKTKGYAAAAQQENENEDSSKNKRSKAFCFLATL